MRIDVYMYLHRGSIVNHRKGLIICIRTRCALNILAQHKSGGLISFAVTPVEFTVEHLTPTHGLMVITNINESNPIIGFWL